MFQLGPWVSLLVKAMMMMADKTLIESGGVLGQRILKEKWISAKNPSWEYSLLIFMLMMMKTEGILL